MRLSLRPGERVYINGAVLRVDRKVGIELLNDATFLLEAHVLQAEEATTPLRQLYFAAQTMLIDPANAGPARSLYASLQAGILALTGSDAIRDGLAVAEAHLAAGRPFDALKTIRSLYPTESALLLGAPTTERGDETGDAALGATPDAIPAPPARTAAEVPARRPLPGAPVRVETRHRRPTAALASAASAAGRRVATILEPEA